MLGTSSRTAANTAALVLTLPTLPLPPPAAATAKVQGATLLAAAAVWHLLVLRTEELVGQGPGGGQAVPATLLSQMWGIIRWAAKR